jgi:hypothetical protein
LKFGQLGSCWTDHVGTVILVCFGSVMIRPWVCVVETGWYFGIGCFILLWFSLWLCVWCGTEFGHVMFRPNMGVLSYWWFSWFIFVNIGVDFWSLNKCSLIYLFGRLCWLKVGCFEVSWPLMKIEYRFWNYVLTLWCFEVEFSKMLNMTFGGLAERLWLCSDDFVMCWDWAFAMVLRQI